MKIRTMVFVLLGAILLASGMTRAQSRTSAATEAGVPRLVQFNGTLKDSAARPVTGAASVTFAIYAEQDGGTALWSETQNVIADPYGHFNALLGGATAAGMPAELFGTGQSRWLGVTVARQQELPRVLLASVPYALKAGDAETLGGLPASAYVTTQSLAGKSSTILAPGSRTILATPETSAPSSAGAGAGAALAAIPQAAPTGGGTTDFIPLWTSASALGNSLLFQTGGNVGINTKTPAETLDVNGNSIFRGSFQLPPGHPAIASSGYESHSFQFQASSFNSTTGVSDTEAFGFRAEPLNNNTPNPSAKLDLFFGAGGSAPFTDTGLSFSNSGIITFAPGQTFSSTSGTFDEINLPNTTSRTNGVITFGGFPALAQYGSPDSIFVGLAAGGEAQETFNANQDTASGFEAMFNLTTGAENSAYGSQSMQSLTTGSFNSGVGWVTLGGTTGGNYNSALGYDAGATNTTGSYNTLIGASADVTSPFISKATAIGENAKVGEGNAIVLGGTGSDAVSVGIGTPTPQSMLELSSAVSGVNFPSPIVTLSNTAGGTGAQVSIDLNTSQPEYTGTYNPSSRILVLDEGGFTDSIVFQANKKGTFNNGLNNTLAIHSNGGVEIFGNLQVDGTVIKSGGSFKIDDPLDPAGKYLSHSFVESPDMKNIYDGVVTLDSNGSAVVELPEWFEALNRDFRYQLTAVGKPGPGLYVAEEVHGNEFKVAGGSAGLKVSWQVTGTRQDAWANAHRIPTVEEKPANEQGHYLHPELFGAGPDRAVGATQASDAGLAAQSLKNR